MFITKSKGFTLIELVVVMLVIALLAAVVVPSARYFIREARIAKLNAFDTAVLDSARMLKAKAIAQGALLNDGTGTILAADLLQRNGSIAGSDVVFLNGYPNATWAIDEYVERISAVGINDPDGFTAPASGVTGITSGGAAIAGCIHTYTPPTVNGQLPTFVVDHTGC